jgi:adenylyl-sulfate kinase
MIAASIFWFTGLSGAGKSTIAEGVARDMVSQGYRVIVLDGDQVRARFHRNLGFTAPDIIENNTMIATLCAESRAHADIVLVPIISPFRTSRALARARLSPGFFEIYIKAGLDTVERRDVKGLYAKAKAGEIDGVIGFSPKAVPYEVPENPDLAIDTERCSADEAIAALSQFVLRTIKNAPKT